MDKDFMLTYYDKMVRPIWTELMKAPRYQRAACEHDKLEREFRRLLDEKLGRKYLELDDALFRVMDDIAEATLNASFNQVEQLKAVSTYDGAEIFEEISEKGPCHFDLISVPLFCQKVKGVMQILFASAGHIL